MMFMWKLRSINRILRWTGWRLTISIDDKMLQNKGTPADHSIHEPTRIGFTWYGWSFVRHLDTDLKDPK